MRQAVRLALRRLRDTPGFTAIVVASLACGIGLNILIFGFTSPVLFKGLPYPEPDSLLDIGMAPPDKPDARGPVAPALYFLLRDRTAEAFDAVGVFDAGRSANLSGDASGPAERLEGHRITATGLAALGTTPLLGKLPVAADEQAGATPTMVLSYPLWQRRFAGRADVIGQSVKVDGQPTQIVGVMPKGFGLLDNSSDAWFTFGFEPVPGQETQHTLRAVGRLKPGVSIPQAQAAVKTALDEYARAFPNRDKGWTVELTPWREARLGGLRRPLTMVQLAVGAMLLLLCVNVGALLRAHTVGRARSTPLASAQSRPRVVLAESLLLSLAGTVIGAGLAAWGLPALRELTPAVLPRLNEVTIDGAVLGFSVVLCLLTTLAIGAVPAWRASRPEATNESTGRPWRGRLGATLLVVIVAVQMALAFVLLAGTGLALRGLRDMQGRDVGVNPSGLLSFDVYLPRDPYVTPNVAKVGSVDITEFNPAGPAVYDRIRAALQTMPGVVQAAGMGAHPFASNPFVQFFIGDAEHTPDNQAAAQYLAVTENYFNTMGIRLIRGRDFSAADQADSPWVVLVNETLAKQQWPNREAVGQRLTLTFSPNDEEPQREIIGIVADTLPFRGASEVPPLIYILHRQQAPRQRASLEGRRTVMSFVARTAGDPLALGDEIRPLVGKVDITTPVTAIRTVQFYLDAGQTALLQFAVALLGLFALVALVGAVVGISGMTSYGVTHRHSTLTRVVGALAAVLIGSAVGLVAWLRLGSVIAPFLTNLSVTPSDAGPLVVTGGLLLTTTLFACLVPVVRSTSAGRL